MATVRLYLDCRAVPKGKPAPLKLAFTEKGSTCYIGLDVKVAPSQWDQKTERVLAHPNKAGLNAYLLSMKSRAMGLIERLDAAHALDGLTAAQVKKAVAVNLIQ